MHDDKFAGAMLAHLGLSDIGELDAAGQYWFWDVVVGAEMQADGDGNRGPELKDFECAREGLAHRLRHDLSLAEREAREAYFLVHPEAAIPELEKKIESILNRIKVEENDGQEMEYGRGLERVRELEWELESVRNQIGEAKAELVAPEGPRVVESRIKKGIDARGKVRKIKADIKAIEHLGPSIRVARPALASRVMNALAMHGYAEPEQLTLRYIVEHVKDFRCVYGPKGGEKMALLAWIYKMPDQDFRSLGSLEEVDATIAELTGMSRANPGGDGGMAYWLAQRRERFVKSQGQDRALNR